MLSLTPALAQEREPPTRLDPVVVTTTRLEQRASEAPASVTVIMRDDIEHSASQTVDNLLRQVPGFSLFRRSSSLVTHPTAQGVSLRGIGPSGASRALVLMDGIPINDPFGGWVYWSRIPRLGIEQIEVVRGGGSSVWGNGALGGVIHVVTRRPTERTASLEASYGSRDTTNVDLLLTEKLGPVRLGLEGNFFDSDGYRIVRDSRRGPIDIDVDSEHRTVNGRADVVLLPDVSFFLAGNVFEEERGNGTPLQFNDTASELVAAGARIRTADRSVWTASVDAQFQKFRSTFTTQAVDRRSETLALDQRVPSTAVGGSVGWSRPFAKHLVLSGLDARWVEGETNEKRYTPTGFLAFRDAGGAQVISGLYVQDVWTPVERWELVGGLRGDYWVAYEGFRRDRTPNGRPVKQAFSDMDRLALSPRLATLVHVTSLTDVKASVYQGFRAPTINELYRTFRVRNDVTTANEHLRPERLTGGDLGVQQRWGPLDARVTGFWNEVKDLVANVTLATRLADCPVGTTCRRRQNLDLARIRGVESELELRLGKDWRLLASHLFSETTVLEATAQRALEGKRLAQVPENAATFSVRYDHPAWLSGAVTARIVGGQFEDDQNTLPLGSYTVFDVMLSRRLAKWAEVFVGVENLLDETYSVARTSEGVVSIGAPRLVHGGARLRF